MKAADVTRLAVVGGGGSFDATRQGIGKIRTTLPEAYKADAITDEIEYSAHSRQRSMVRYASPKATSILAQRPLNPDGFPREHEFMSTEMQNFHNSLVYSESVSVIDSSHSQPGRPR